MEGEQRPSSVRGGPDRNNGSQAIELVATYRPGSHQPEPPKARVAEERYNNLEAHVQPHPEVVCGGESPNGD